LRRSLDAQPFSLSGGQKQKVALAAILALEPRLLLLDEPASSLDPRASGWLVDHLLDCGKTVVTSTHNLSMAAELGERAIVLGEGGRLLYDGPLQEALRDRALLEAANLVHRHRHRHDGIEHVHTHSARLGVEPLIRPRWDNCGHERIPRRGPHPAPHAAAARRAAPARGAGRPPSGRQEHHLPGGLQRRPAATRAWPAHRPTRSAWSASASRKSRWSTCRRSNPCTICAKPTAWCSCICSGATAGR
jgi:hypothetical protein